MNTAAAHALAEEAARAAGTYLHSEYEQKQEVLSAAGRDIKIAADQKAERIILNTLGQSEYPILAEESGEHGAIGEDSVFWVVDPLDGTMNFAQSIPFCAVSIALTRNRTPIVGVILDFLREELFSGVAGEWAACNGAPMSVSNRTRRSEAVLATGFPARFSFEAAATRDFVGAMASYKKVRMLGSAALALAYVAAGRLDAYWEEGGMYWDVAAGLALVHGAGGVTRTEPLVGPSGPLRVHAAATQALLDD